MDSTSYHTSFSPSETHTAFAGACSSSSPSGDIHFDFEHHLCTYTFHIYVFQQSDLSLCTAVAQNIENIYPVLSVLRQPVLELFSEYFLSVTPSSGTAQAVPESPTGFGALELTFVAPRNKVSEEVSVI